MMLTGSRQWLQAFLSQTECVPENVPAPRSRAAALTLLSTIKSVTDFYLQDPKQAPPLKSETNRAIHEQLQQFTEGLDRDCQDLAVFAVTPKGDLSIRVLIEHAEEKFSANLLAVMPPKTIKDIQEAGKCLVFERATACGFHICRATEALMLAYYEKLANQPWPFAQRDWGKYNQQLKALNAPASITTRLDEIRTMNLNAYAHPDLTVEVEEAPIIYNLCTGVIYYMAKEML
jgi:hypothetical protein